MGDHDRPGGKVERRHPIVAPALRAKTDPRIMGRITCPCAGWQGQLQHQRRNPIFPLDADSIEGHEPREARARALHLRDEEDCLALELQRHA